MLNLCVNDRTISDKTNTENAGIIESNSRIHPFTFISIYQFSRNMYITEGSTTSFTFAFSPM